MNEVPYSLLLLPGRKLEFFGNKITSFTITTKFSLLMVVFWLGSKSYYFQNYDRAVKQRMHDLNIIICLSWDQSLVAFFGSVVGQTENPRGRVTSGSPEKLDLRSALLILKLSWIWNILRCLDERNQKEEGNCDGVGRTGQSHAEEWN